MKRLVCLTAVSAGLVGIWMLSNGWTHDGHSHQKQRQAPDRGIDRVQGFFPRNDGPNCRGGFCPTGPRFGNVDFGRDNRGVAGLVRPKPLGLRTLAHRVEYAAEILSEEIGDELPRSRFTARMLNLADDFQKKSRHFRLSVDRGGKPAHLLKDFQAMTGAYVAVARPLGDLRRAILVNRALGRTERLLRQVSAQLRIDKGAPRVLPPQPPTMPRKPAAVTIPQTMKDIALLPANQQAAALAQKTCPVTGGLLGSHGKPLTVDINGRTVFVCCRGCVADLKENPAKYLKSK